MKATLSGVFIAVLTAMSLSHAQSADETGTFGIERGTGKVICTGDLDERQAAATDPSYARSLWWDRLTFGTDASQCAPQRLEPVVAGTWARTDQFSGTDAAGRRADFRLYVLDERYSWVLGSSSAVRDSTGSAALSDIFDRPGLVSELCAADATIAIGAASHEGPTALNHQLARNRGERIGEALRSVTGGCAGAAPGVLAVSLGEHQDRNGCTSTGACAGDTSPQRQVVLIAADQVDAGVNLLEALRNGLSGRALSGFVSLGDYDQFAPVSF